jgi:hypothetical protein
LLYSDFIHINTVGLFIVAEIRVKQLITSSQTHWQSVSLVTLTKIDTQEHRALANWWVRRLTTYILG